MESLVTGPLSPEELRKMSVGQIYLFDNPLLHGYDHIDVVPAAQAMIVDREQGVDEYGGRA
jgi:hypothetical protein